ncbi:hypothetical protein QBC33DRAFT_544292 [Phialemonium atrogriseum]|uniref:Uncharacterized protein n=1 Tax=Phialemonium atrogriseum TaxID=1093897 RepID=A0AAJ0FFG2_9PEZI|nr:uncharacterized protein QBC33DRAFT_544292 [Phialemonium atrogriseum]KAK1765432.1 hypothetical protein QBC33DRAFT_544292 [Phialemonium atrogriseum]
MPTAEAPKPQAPMEASAPPAPGTVVKRQPEAQPRPEPENEMTLRGGGMNLGCTCCDGTCSFHRSCC